MFENATVILHTYIATLTTLTHALTQPCRARE